MNGNRIDLADIYGLNRNDDRRTYGNMMDTAPPALEQLAGRGNLSTGSMDTRDDMSNSVGMTESSVGRMVSDMNRINDMQRDMRENDMDKIMVNSQGTGSSVDMDKCQAGRCRFAPIPHEHTVEQDFNRNNGLMPIPEYNQPYPINADNIQYLNTFIRSQVGRRVHVEFLIGTNNIVEKEGYLMAVGANFILLNPADTKDMLVCDFHNIKFMKFYY